MTQPNNHSFLDTILDHKRSSELPQRKRHVPLETIRRTAESATTPVLDLTTALWRADQRVALIAEVKRASPSKGDLVKGDFRPIDLACAYESNGASAISVLTDEQFFKGSLDHLTAVRAAVKVPLLRKDFVIDPYQLYEARNAGADATLLIVAALDDATLADLHALARELGLAPLVEVHDEHETERALKLGAAIIGINNRDLRTFTTDLGATARCARAILGTSIVGTPHAGQPIIVSESGIFTPQDVETVAAMGAGAVLVGESIITSGHVGEQVRALSQVLRHGPSDEAAKDQEQVGNPASVRSVEDDHRKDLRHH